MSKKDMDFLKLQKLWYGKLKKSGFIDIEERGILKDYPGSRLLRDYCRKKGNFYDTSRLEEKQNYFRFASQLLWTHSFRSSFEKRIFLLHSEGFSLREISKVIKRKMSPDTIRLLLKPLRQKVYSLMLEESHDEE